MSNMVERRALRPSSSIAAGRGARLSTGKLADATSENKAGRKVR
jgi:hypothetical protein